MSALIYVFVGGGLGSMALYGFTRWIDQKASGIPWATFAANMLSCLILGILIGIQLNNDLGVQKRLLLMTGFCGGFSTFSTFSGEIYHMATQQQIGLAFFYVGASLLIGLLLVFIGIKIISI